MALPSSWDSKDQVPDWAKADVVERDGKWVLTVEGFEPKAKVDEFRSNNTQLKKTIEELQAKLTGALSADEAAKLRGELESARNRLEAGEADERVNELVEKRIVTVRIGDRDVKVAKTDKPVLEALLKAKEDALSQTSTTARTLMSELGKERIIGGAHMAMAELGGFRDGAKDDVIRHIAEAFRLGEDHQPYMPDPEDKEGKTPRVGTDGKPITIAEYLGEFKASGRKAGIWFEEAKGPGTGRKMVPQKTASAPADQPRGVGRIQKGLLAQQAAK